MNWYFWLAISTSLLGPCCYYLISMHGQVSRFFDGLIMMALICLVTLHILPESIEHAGAATLIAVILGLIGPLLLSQLLKRKQCEIQKPFLIISVIGFIAHNMLDGAALIVHPQAQSSTHLLALAVALHRLIESIAVWNTISNSFGYFKGFLAVVGLSLAMAAGFFFGEQIFTRMDENILHALQALACGMIFHVLLHPHHLKEFLNESRSGKILLKTQSAGALCGLLLAALAYLFWPTQGHENGHRIEKVEGHAKTDRQ